MAALRGGADRVPGAGEVTKLSCRLYGSLAFTGKGHSTDRAVVLGLAGETPAGIAPDKADVLEAKIADEKQIEVEGLGILSFAPGVDIVFDYGPALPYHANGMKLFAHDAAGNLALEETYYSIGGGFVVTEREMTRRDKAEDAAQAEEAGWPYPFSSAEEMLTMAHASGKSIAEMKRANEEVALGGTLTARIDAISGAMDAT